MINNKGSYHVRRDKRKKGSTEKSVLPNLMRCPTAVCILLIHRIRQSRRMCLPDYIILWTQLHFLCSLSICRRFPNVQKIVHHPNQLFPSFTHCKAVPSLGPSLELIYILLTRLFSQSYDDKQPDYFTTFPNNLWLLIVKNLTNWFEICFINEFFDYLCCFVIHLNIIRAIPFTYFGVKSNFWP